MSAETKPPISSEAAKEFVLNSHGNLARVQEMLAGEPALANAVWDWGGGDWETALGAAAHVGNREIALFLLDNGARLEIFTAAMLGQIEIVRAMLEAFPHMRELPGTHGFSLLDHARAGGPQAKEVVRFLEQD